MKVLTALLADYALAHKDGKLYVTGGGIHLLRVPTIPYTYPRLSLAGSVSFEAEEFDEPQSIIIDSKGPGGDAFIRPANIWLLPRQEEGGTFPAVIPFVYHVADVLLTREGSYTLTMRWGEDGVHELPSLRVVRDAAHVESWRVSNAAGYEAYSRGNLEGARAAFERTVAEHGGDVQGHNNLGFVLLQLGRAAEALEHFEHAARLGYPSAEVIDANIACCRYLLGESALALDGFRQCFRERTLTSVTYLLEIVDGALISRSLKSSSEYVRLMAVNAGWSAWRAGLLDDARHWVSVAADAESELGGPSDSSLSALRKLIHT